MIMMTRLIPSSAIAIAVALPWFSGTAQATEQDTSYLDDCKIWQAPSTLEGAGFGVFVADDFEDGEEIGDDIVIPIVDLEVYNAHKQTDPMDLWYLVFLYWWDGMDGNTRHEGFYDVGGFHSGIGASPNCFFDILNSLFYYPKFQDSAGLHRSQDPGVGAFTEHGGYALRASRDVKAGDELFVNYGSHYFQREKTMYKYGPVPLWNDLSRAAVLFRKFLTVKTAVSRQENNNDVNAEAVMTDLWDTFIRRHQDEYPMSRVFGSFNPNDPNELEVLEKEYKGDLTQLRRDQSNRPVEWLRENGVCADHIVYKTSTLPQAGRGAFARRDLPEGALVATVPLVQIADRTIFDMYPIEQNDEGIWWANRTTKLQPQLAVNYCFGHKDSTLLLKPYGFGTDYINHNQTLANVKLQWSDPSRSVHDPEFLKKPISEFANLYFTRLAFELIATRPIKEGEEIFMDYGDDWERAWQEHVKQWRPMPGAESYVPAWKLEKEEHILRTVTEEEDNPYPPNVEVHCWEQFLSHNWESDWDWDEQWIDYPQNHWPVTILSREVDEDGEEGDYLYTVFEPEDERTYEGLPRKALVIADKPHTTDMFLNNAFRHHIQIPDSLFPEKWKNNKASKENDAHDEL